MEGIEHRCARACMCGGYGCESAHAEQWNWQWVVSSGNHSCNLIRIFRTGYCGLLRSPAVFTGSHSLILYALYNSLSLVLLAVDTQALLRNDHLYQVSPEEKEMKMGGGVSGGGEADTRCYVHV